MDLLAEIRAAWPATPYPGDHILSECWCEECEFSVRNLRGKSWKQLTLEDIDGESDQMGCEAFRYYLPGLLVLSIRNPDEDHLICNINSRFVFSDHKGEDPNKRQQICQLIGSFSQRQRQVLLKYFDWVDANRDSQIPASLQTEKRAIRDGVIEPYSYNDLLSWARQYERELKSRK